MLKALAWKEWREQRPAILAGLALAAVLPAFIAAGSVVQDGGPRDLLTALPVAFLGGLWPLMAAAAGSITIANESEEGTLRFLLSRPISRRRIWLVKVGAALAAVAVVALFSLLVIWFVNRLLQPESAAAGVATIVGGVGTTIYDPLALLSATVLLFSCSVLCSALLTRTLTAAAAGLALAMALMAGVFLLWSRLSLVPRLEPQWLALELVAISAAVLLASLIVFARGELFGGGGGLAGGATRGGRTLAGALVGGATRGGRPLAGALVGGATPGGRTLAGALVGGATPGGRTLAGGLLVMTLAAGLLPAVFARASLSSADARIEAESVVLLSGREIVMTVADRGAAATQIWALRPDGSGIFPLTGRHTFSPAAVPGGNWIAYLSRRGIAGGRGGGLDLRLVDRSGTVDRLVLRDIPAGRPLFFNQIVPSRFSPDHRVAFLDRNRLTVARLDGRGGETRDVSGTPLENAIVLGFTAGSGSPAWDWLLFLPAGSAGSPASSTGSSAGSAGSPAGSTGSPAGSVGLQAGSSGLALGGRAATTLSAYHVESGEVRPLYDLPAGWRMPMLQWGRRDPATGVPDGGWSYLPVIAPVESPDAETAAAGTGAARSRAASTGAAISGVAGTEAAGAGAASRLAAEAETGAAGATVAIVLIDVAVIDAAGDLDDPARAGVPIHRFDVTWNDPVARRDFERCAALDLPESRRWSDRDDGRIYREPQVLFGDCTPAARRRGAELLAGASGPAGDRVSAGSRRLSGGLIRLQGLETGEERRWPLPGDWSQPSAGAPAADAVRINDLFLSQAQDEVLLDIRGVDDATSYAVAIGRNGASRRFPPGWVPLGWLDRNLFILQGGGDGTVAFAIGDARTGRVRDLYRRAEADR